MYVQVVVCKRPRLLFRQDTTRNTAFLVISDRKNECYSRTVDRFVLLCARAWTASGEDSD